MMQSCIGSICSWLYCDHVIPFRCLDQSHMEDLLVENIDGQIPSELIFYATHFHFCCKITYIIIGLIRGGVLKSGTQLRATPVLALRYYTHLLQILASACMPH